MRHLKPNTFNLANAGLFPNVVDYHLQIALVSIISWPRGTDVTYFPYDLVGDDNFAFFKQVVAFHPIEKVLAVQDWDLSNAGSGFAIALVTFLYVDILDCTGTLYSMARFGGFINERTQGE